MLQSRDRKEAGSVLALLPMTKARASFARLDKLKHVLPNSISFFTLFLIHPIVVFDLTPV
jgi:hypothetical protein